MNKKTVDALYADFEKIEERGPFGHPGGRQPCGMNQLGGRDAQLFGQGAETGLRALHIEFRQL